MPTVLNVAEKPSVAKEASKILAGGRQPYSEQGLCVLRHPYTRPPASRGPGSAHCRLHCLELLLSVATARFSRGSAAPRRSRYNPVWKFQYTVQGQHCDMRFTSIAGHLQAGALRALWN